MPDRTDIVIPIYNEGGSVEELVARLRRACPGAKLIFVDNASTDGTLALLSVMAGVRVIRHCENLGYGRSLLDGIAASEAERIVMIDADLEYWPEDIPALVAGLDSADAVFGSRLLARDRPHPLPAARAIGNRLVTSLFDLLFGQSLTDLYTGLRAVRRSALPRDGLRQSGFEFVLELAARLAASGARLAEVPVRYTPRALGESKMRHAREVAKFAYHLVRLRLS